MVTFFFRTSKWINSLATLEGGRKEIWLIDSRSHDLVEIGAALRFITLSSSSIQQNSAWEKSSSRLPLLPLWPRTFERGSRREGGHKWSTGSGSRVGHRKKWVQTGHELRFTQVNTGHCGVSYYPIILYYIILYYAIFALPENPDPVCLCMSVCIKQPVSGRSFVSH